MLFTQPTRNNASSVPATVISSGAFMLWAKGVNQRDLELASAAFGNESAVGTLARWLTSFESGASAFCEGVFQDAQHRSFMAEQGFPFAMGLRYQVYTLQALQLRFAPSSQMDREKASAGLKEYRKAMCKQLAQPGNLRNSKALSGHAKAHPAPPMPGVSLVLTAVATPQQARNRTASHSSLNVRGTIAMIVHHLQDPGELLLVPLRRHTEQGHCSDLVAEVFQQALTQGDTHQIAFDTALPVRNDAHLLLTGMTLSSLDTLASFITEGKASWSAHPILCAMQRMWVKAATPPASWQSRPNMSRAVLLTLDLGFHCDRNPEGFPRYYEFIHAAMATNPDLSDALISETNFVTVTIDFRRFACDMGAEGWCNGVGAAVDKVRACPGAFRGLIDHIIQQGIVNTVTDWRLCLRCFEQAPSLCDSLL